MMNKQNIFALIVAGGSGSRASKEIPKQYMDVAGIPMLRRSIQLFKTHQGISGVRVVIRREDHSLYKKAVAGISICPCVIGGVRRQDSVRIGLEALKEHNPTHVLIHDAARPVVSHELISRTIKSLSEYDAVLPVLEVADTIKKIDGNEITTINREKLFLAQTPQGFLYSLISELHNKHESQNVTDDIALAELAKTKVGIIAGERQNIKITTMEDFKIAESFIK